MQMAFSDIFNEMHLLRNELGLVPGVLFVQRAFEYNGEFDMTEEKALAFIEDTIATDVSYGGRRFKHLESQKCCFPGRDGPEYAFTEADGVAFLTS
jgi:hypothetical protein